MLDLARSLRRRGHRITVLSLAHGGALMQLFREIPIISIERRGGLDGKLPWQLTRLFRELRLDVVHTHNPAALTYAAPAARWAGVPRLIHTKHGANPPRSRADLLVRRALVRMCDAYVAVSKPTADVARRLDRAPERLVRVIPNGVDALRYAHDPAQRLAIRNRLGISEDALIIGTVGRLAPEKNQKLLIEAALPLLGPGAHLVIVGDGPEREALEKAIPDSVRSFVHLVGARDDIPALLSAFDLFVLSSRTEGLPLVVPEAMAVGLPVIATNVGGLSTVVRQHQTGLLVPSGDKCSLSAAIEMLLHDDERRRELGREAAIDASRRFGLERVVDAYEALYFANSDSPDMPSGSSSGRRGARRGSSLQFGLMT